MPRAPGHFEQAAAELLRALRGRRSQVAWARRLGYRSNPITDWEHGRRFPTAPETLRAAARAGVDLTRVFAAFLPAPPPSAKAQWSVASWLDTLRGSMSVVALARLSGRSRFSVARWLSGASTPRLPDFLRLLEAINGRLAEWVALLVPIDRVPSLEPIYKRMSTARRVSVDLPWSEAVLRVLETTRYAALAAHSDAFVAETLALPVPVVSEIVRALESARVIERVERLYRVSGALVVDTKVDANAVQRLRRHWAQVAAARATGGTDDWFAYNVISCSEKDCELIEQRLRAAFREVRSIVAASQPIERAALLTIQLTRW
ncbi:MAG TPA: helix-turn-helix transcriptional regulator [Polyangiales bacterium]|nr:helix-turn-helix transcriptional regulator [Polyangiales bacterium]